MSIENQIYEVSKNKILVTRLGIGIFNGRWPDSNLRSERHYWFEFSENEDLIDTDVPDQDDGPAAKALVEDCREYLFRGEIPEWVKL